MPLAEQIIDQQVTGILDRHGDVFAGELGLGADEAARRSVAFLFLVARTAFDLTDEQTIDGIVEGGNDFGFAAMLMGSFLLDEMGIRLDRLDHRNFGEVRELVEQRSDDYLLRAETRIGAALEPLFSNRKRTLQRLSATFRRADLVEVLEGNDT